MSLNKNLIALDKFINQALYNPKKGFYMKKNPFGSKGDFLTSPNSTGSSCSICVIYAADSSSDIFPNIAAIDFPHPLLNFLL